MSRNADLVRRWYDEVGSRFENPGASYELLDPAVVLDATRLSVPDYARVFHGHEGVREFWRSFLASWEDYWCRPEELVERGDRVLLTMYNRARGRGSGVEVESRHAQIWTFRDGRVVRCDFYDDREAAVAELG